MTKNSIIKPILAGFLIPALLAGIILSQITLSNAARAADGDLTIDLTVRNLTGNYYYSSFAESVSAAGSDRVQFRIIVKNTGNYIMYNARTSVSLPSDLGFVPGSTRVEGGYVADGLTSNGIHIGTIYPGYNREILFEATVANRGSGYSNQTLTAYAYVRADQWSEKNDSATVYASSSSYSPYYPYYPSAYLNIYSYVRNITTGQGALNTSVNAKTGDRLMFTIQLTTPGSSQINNVRVWSVLPSGLIFVNGSARLDNNTSVSDSLVSGGAYIGTIFGSQTKTITYEATVNSNLANQTLTNYSYVSGDGIPQQSNFAQVVIASGSVYPSPSPSYSPSPWPTPTPTHTPASIPSPTVKGISVYAVTGGDSLARTAGLALIIALLTIISVYSIMEYPEFRVRMNLKAKIWKIRLNEII